MLSGRFEHSETAALRARSVPCIAAPSLEEFERAHVAPRVPVVLRGLVSEWPALRRWSRDYLRERFGAAVVTTIRADAGRVLMEGGKDEIEQPMRLGDYLASLDADAPRRYLTSPLKDLPEGLRRDAPPPAYCGAASWSNGNLWIGAAGTIARMHRDLADNLHALVFGRKRVTLVSPRQSALLYPHGVFDTFPNGCRADIEHPDFARFPRLRRVEPVVAEMEPGDAIYIPRRWWHHVRTLEPSASVNYWWANGAQRALIQAADVFKRIRGLSR